MAILYFTSNEIQRYQKCEMAFRNIFNVYCCILFGFSTFEATSLTPLYDMSTDTSFQLLNFLSSGPPAGAGSLLQQTAILEALWHALVLLPDIVAEIVDRFPLLS